MSAPIEAMTLSDWTDSEVVLLAVALNSGATVKGLANVSEELASKLNDRLFAVVQDELKRREVHPHDLLRVLVGRAVTTLLKEGNDKDAAEK